MTVMKSRLLLVPAILAATAAFGAPEYARSEPVDAQSHAATLLSGLRPTAPLAARDDRDAPSSSVAADAQASAAALLAGRSAGGQANTGARIEPSTADRTQTDAHAHAAALLSGSRTSARERPRVTATAPFGDHPAVLVAKQWDARGIDPNQFIVAHPASLHWTDGSATL
jgi:hypothetical protein